MKTETTKRPMRSLYQVFTIAKFPRRRYKRCDSDRGYWHVWHFDALRYKPATTQKCECGLLEWGTQAAPDWSKA